MANKNTAVLESTAKDEQTPLMAGDEKQVSSKADQKSIAKRLEDFLIDLGTDKDARILMLDQFGKPNRWDAFQHVPHNEQRIITLRVLIIDEPRQ